ncbi:MAG: hypothetical protein AABY22_32775 [Nanoarchaeota archaeon]
MKQMKQICKQCGEEIKNIKVSKSYDYYYFCKEGDCLQKYRRENDR